MTSMCLAFSLSTQNHHHQGGVQEGGFHRLQKKIKALPALNLLHCLTAVLSRVLSAPSNVVWGHKDCRVKCILQLVRTLPPQTVTLFLPPTSSWSAGGQQSPTLLICLVVCLNKKPINAQILDLPAYICTLWVFSVVHLKSVDWGTALEVQWLRLRASTAGDTGSIPGGGTRIPHATWHGQKKKKSVDWAPSMCRAVESHTFCPHWAKGELALHRLLMYLCWDIGGSQLKLRFFPRMSVLTAKGWWGHLQALAAWWKIFSVQGSLLGVLGHKHLSLCPWNLHLLACAQMSPYQSHSLLQNSTPGPPPCLLSRYISTWHCTLICLFVSICVPTLGCHLPQSCFTHCCVRGTRTAPSRQLKLHTFL